MTVEELHPYPVAPASGLQVLKEELDPANQSLADALRKSFRILKLLMLVLLGLYLLSGAFRVEQGEVGLVLRYGRITGAGGGADSSVLAPGWHWSWPYPFERWVTIPTSERQVQVAFLFQLSDAEKTSGIKGYKSDNLSPVRDDYLITGDVNILHASLAVKYHITDPIAYLTNVYPMPDPAADVRSSAYRRYPEYGVLVDLARDAVIETAARREALAVRGEDQDAFLFAVGFRLKEKLKGLEEAGASLGISVDPNSAIIAPKAEGMEAIMPPRQTQQVFDQVQAAESQKSGTITKARSQAQELLVNTAGPEYERMASAIEREFELMLALSEAESGPGGSEHQAAEVERLGQALEEQRRLAEELLATVATGNVRAILQDAAIARDAVIKEAAGDYARFTAVRPEYLRNPGVFMSRLLDETYAQALNSEQVAKLYIPSNHKEIRLLIPRGGRQMGDTQKEEN